MKRTTILLETGGDSHDDANAFTAEAVRPANPFSGKLAKYVDLQLTDTRLELVIRVPLASRGLDQVRTALDKMSAELDAILTEGEEAA